MDYVPVLWLVLQKASGPDDYVLATGVSHSLREFCEIAFRRVDLDYRDFVTHTSGAQRRNEAAPLVGNSGKAQKRLGWSHTRNKHSKSWFA